MRSDTPTERGTVLVIAAGDEGFDLLKVGLTHASHLADLMDPVPLEFFRCRLVIHIR